MSATLTLNFGGFSQALATFGKLENFERHELLDCLGTEVESQTRRRLDQPRGSEVGPDGQPWPKWSEEHKSTRHRNHKMLQDTGAMLDSITHEVQGDDAVAVGTNKPYAGLHQFGGTYKRTAREGSARLRTNRRGEILRQGSHGPLANLAVFAKSKGARAHRLYIERKFTVPEHDVTMPARPFLGLSERDQRDVVDIAQEFFRSLLP